MFHIRLRSIIGWITIVALFLQGIIPMASLAVTTDGSASGWTRDKAEHLARRTLFSPSKEIIDTLFQAGSATAAVDILFPSVSGSDRTGFDTKWQEFTGTGWEKNVNTGGVNYADASHMARLYQFRYAADPYEAKMKLFSVFEDIFSVNVGGSIKYKDIQNLHTLIYGNMLGSYKNLVKRVLLNNPNEKGDYSVSEFLNLLNTDKNAPNENYARELLQLMLMDEFLPGNSKENEADRNYSEDDVYHLSLILTGFGSNRYQGYTVAPDEEVAYYTGSNHNRKNNVAFLPGMTGSVSFPFYDSINDTISLTGIEMPIGGNNGLGDNIIDYIFAKRSHAIALFLSNKLFRFYIHENPTSADLEKLATKLEENNFDIYSSVKWLLSDDMMYSDTAMNALLYKNPLELSIGLLKILHTKDVSVIDPNFYKQPALLSNLGWTPYIPGSIFGRAGFDTNYKWYSGYTHTQWINMATRIFYDYTGTGAYRMDAIIPVMSHDGVDISINEFITQAEDTLLGGRRLSPQVRNRISEYLTTSETGSTIPFRPNVLAYQKVKFPWVFALMVTQPEYILKSGVDIPETPKSSEPTSIESATGKLIIVELPGGYDWLHGLVKKSDYPYYSYIRTSASGSIALSSENLVDIGDYYLNPYLAYSGGNIANGPAFIDLLDQGYLKIFDRVGTPLHSRNHDEAQQKIASIDNTARNTAGIGIIGELTAYEPDALNTVVLGGGRPFIYQWWNYLNIGNNDSRITNVNPGGRLNAKQMSQQIQLITNTLSGRIYPGSTRSVFESSLKLSNAVTLAVSKGGSAGVGYTMKSQLQFAKTMLDNNFWHIFYLSNGGNGWDSHEGELTSRNLNGGLGYLASTLSDFFRQIKDTQNVTIVVYSEFGRTTPVNGTLGTDHGEWGGMFVLTSNPDLMQSWSGKKVLGTANLLQERANWLSPGIDYRSIYGKILSSLFRVPEKWFFTNYYRSLDDDLSTDPAKFALARTEFRANGNNSVEVAVRYQVEGKNFDTTKGSYSAAWYLSGSDFVSYAAPASLAYTGSNTRLANNYRNITESSNHTFSFNPASVHIRFFEMNSNYSYIVAAYNDQMVPVTTSGTVLLPKVLASGNKQPLTGYDTILNSYYNTTVSGSTLLSGSGIILSKNATGTILYSKGKGITMRTGTGGDTFVSEVHSASGVIKWNGTFLLGEDMDATTFLSQKAKITDLGLNLSDFPIERIVRMGSDTLGVGMTLTRPVTVSIEKMIPHGSYTILTSIDGLDWHRQSTDVLSASASGVLEFPTDHFSFFALAPVSDVPLCSLSSDITTIQNGTPAKLSWTSFHATNISIDQGIGTVADSGSVDVLPPNNSTTNYVLTVSSGAQSRSCQVSVTTLAVPSCTITTPKYFVKERSPLTLSWTGISAHAARMLPLATTVPPTGQITVNPMMDTTYTIEVSNPVGTGSCSTAITTYPNQAPIASFDTFSVEAGTSTGLAILANDTDPNPDDPIVIADIMTPPTRGTVTVIDGMSVEYSAPGDLCGGSDAFMYRIKDSDGVLSNPTSVNVLITCSNSGSTNSGSTNSGAIDTSSGTTGSGGTSSGTTGSGGTSSWNIDTGSGSTNSGSTNSGSIDIGSGSIDTGSWNTASGSIDVGSGSTGSGTIGSGSTASGSIDTSSGSSSNSSGSTGSGSIDVGSGPNGSGSTASSIIIDTASGNTHSGGTIDLNQTGTYLTGSITIDAFQSHESGASTDVLSNVIARLGSSIELRNADIFLSNPFDGASVSLSGNLSLFVEWSLWSGELLAPNRLENGLSSNISVTDVWVSAGLPIDSEISQWIFRTYTHTILGTYQVGAPDSSLALSGGYARITLMIPSAAVGNDVTIFRSEDGQHWERNSPTESCDIQANGGCSFLTNHFSYFGLIDSVAFDEQNSIVALSGVGPGGPSSFSFGTLMFPFSPVMLTKSGSLLVDSGSVISHSGILLVVQNMQSEIETILDTEFQNTKHRSTRFFAQKIFSRMLHDYTTSVDRAARLAEIQKALITQAQKNQKNQAYVQWVIDTISGLWSQYQNLPTRVPSTRIDSARVTPFWNDIEISEVVAKNTQLVNVVHSVFLRQQQGKGKILDVLYRDSQVTVEYITGKFAMIRTSEGISGWLHRSFLK